MQLLDGAGGVKALGQEDDPVEEEKGSDAVDDVLHQLYSVKEQRGELHTSNLQRLLGDKKSCLRGFFFFLPRNRLGSWFNFNISTNSREPQAKCGDHR